MTSIDEPDARTLYLITILITQGERALYREVLGNSPVRRRLGILSMWRPEWLQETFPEGLPDAWIESTGKACWARWYREARDAR